MTRLTRDGKSAAPVWTADGRRIAWTFGDDENREVRWQPSDGSGREEAVFAGQPVASATFSPDGRMVAGMVPDGPGADVVVGALDVAGLPRTVVKMATSAFAPRFSPDGRWIAYQAAAESRPFEVFVSAVSGAGGRVQVSTDGGTEPLWAPDGHTLYYRTRSRVMAASVTTAPAFGVTRRDSLFGDSFELGTADQGYDIARDGKSFLMVRAGNSQQRAIVVFRWLDDLRERMAMAARK